MICGRQGEITQPQHCCSASWPWLPSPQHNSRSPAVFDGRAPSHCRNVMLSDSANTPERRGRRRGKSHRDAKIALAQGGCVDCLRPIYASCTFFLLPFYGLALTCHHIDLYVIFKRSCTVPTLFEALQLCRSLPKARHFLKRHHRQPRLGRGSSNMQEHIHPHFIEMSTTCLL